jgi:hypothetical protein
MRRTAGSAASPPTITLVTPNIGSAAGGWSIKITGTNFTGATGVNVAGMACTSVVVVNATTITAVAPALSSANGSTTGQSVTVQTPGGSATGSTVPTKYFYLPSNKSFAFAHRSDVGITTASGKTTAMADQSGNGVNLTGVVATAPNAPTGNFSSSGLPYIAFDGTDDFLSASLSSTVLDGQFSFFFAGNYVAVTGTHISMAVTAGATVHGLRAVDFGGNFICSSGVNNVVITTEDTNPHTFGCISMLATSGTGYVDSTSVTGNLTTLYALTNLTMGCDGTGNSSFTNLNLVCDIGYVGALSAGDQATVMSILKQTCGTP